MWRNLPFRLRNFRSRTITNNQRNMIDQLHRNNNVRFHNRSQQTIVSYFLNPSTRGRVLRRCALAVVGACVGMKVWLVTSDCQEAPALATEALPDPPQTERRWRKGQTLEEAVRKSRDILTRIKDETGSPGIAICVSVDGQEVWSQGLGYSDVENRVPCTPDVVMRIASISKPITTTIVGKLIEEGLLDIDKPVQEYVPKFPEKTVDGEKVTMTTRHLLTHVSGIRHYNKNYMKKDKKDEEKKSAEKESEKESDKEKDKPGVTETEQVEMHIKKHYNSVEESLNLFKDDPLVHKPGTKFLYTTHGYTLLSGVIEGATKRKFKSLLLGLFKDLGLEHTYLDENTPLIYNRSRYYVKNSKGRLVNAPYVDISYKWAGGGLLSTVGDIVKFGNIMLYSYQFKPPKEGPTAQTVQPKHSPTKTHSGKVANEKTKKEAENLEISKKNDTEREKVLTGYLKRETMEKLWSVGENTMSSCSWNEDAGYGFGWDVVPEKVEHGCCRHQRYYISHSGGAVGASSFLLILPRGKGDNPPSGIVIAILANMVSVSLHKTAVKIAQEFDKVEEEI